MRLLKFRVTDFRSVDDSGWIEASEVTALIGTNESGKTNLLVPLWKLNPAGKDGAIDLLADAPRKRYNDIRSGERDVVFIEALFDLGDELASRIAEITGASSEDVAQASVSRRFDGKYAVTFPLDEPLRTLPAEEIRGLLDESKLDIVSGRALKSEESLKATILEALDDVTSKLSASDELDADAVGAIKTALTAINSEGAAKSSVLVPRLGQLRDAVDEFLASVSRPSANSVEAARKAVLAALPKFVYYSNYGNLDSEIYLPHVIENMKRDDLGAREAAKARTLKVLFEFVKLSPNEIQELGRDFRVPNRQPTGDEIADIAKKKKERDVLLQSASAELTQSFRDWWKQGEYRFRFQADGDHFRIWVSDDRRPEDIELEGRSTGLQWFLSFYLIFLVESEDAHEGAILLLDEPGLSLHPVAQRDLSLFFENLANTNQLLYTTHSPFLVDPNHLDRVKAVYIQEDGTTGVSSDLRAGEKDPAQTKSIYPVYAALGLSVSDILLTGSQPVIVEGMADQCYLSAMKVLLIAAGRIAPARELVFVPAGGVRGVRAVAAILSGKDEVLPMVLLDGDAAGRRMANELRANLYAGAPDRIQDVSAFTPVPNAEIEDVVPAQVIVQVITRMLRGPEDDFADVYRPGSPMVAQVETYAQKHELVLPVGWKVELAKQVKARLLKGGPSLLASPDLEQWARLFERLLLVEEQVTVEA